MYVGERENISGEFSKNKFCVLGFRLTSWSNETEQVGVQIEGARRFDMKGVRISVKKDVFVTSSKYGVG